MPRRLVPAVVAVLLLVTSVAASPVGAASADARAAEPGASVPAPTNDTATVTGTGAILAVASAPDGGAYLVGATAPGASNLTVTRLAPNGSVTWQHHYGGPNDSRVGQAVVSADGGVYVLERVASPSGSGSRSRQTARLLRLSEAGSVAWTRSLGNATFQLRESALRPAPGGGVLLARATGTRSPGTRLQRVRPDGSVAWSRTYGGGTPHALAVSPDGDVLVGGQRRFGEGWLLRVAPNGSVEVNETYGGYQDRQVVGVVPTEEGGALLAGSAETRHVGGSDPWVARVDADGVPLWSRTYSTPSRAQVRSALATDAGVLVVSTSSDDPDAPRKRLTHVASDGAVGTTTLETGQFTVTPHLASGTLRLYGYEFDRRNRTVTGTVTTGRLPTPTAAPLAPDANVTTSGTAYRGQNLQLALSPTVEYELYRLPTEYTPFDDPRLVRRLRTDDAGTAAFETATLPDGAYAVRSAQYGWMLLEDGDGAGITTNASLAAFDLETQYLRFGWSGAGRRPARYTPPGPNRTVVETYAGEHGVRVRVDSDRESFTARVEVTRLDGSSVAAETLRAALAPDPQHGSVVEDSSEAGRHYATVEMPAAGDRNVTLNAGALPAGFYRLSVTGEDTADATRPATTRLVVVREARPVTLEPAATNLTVPRNGSATTNLTLSGVEDGVGALRLAANRTGQPAVRLNLRFTDAVEYGSASGGAGMSEDYSSAEVESTEVRRSPNGSFTVARLTVTDSEHFDDGSATGTNTLSVGPVWIADADGVPYSVAGPVTLTYEVVNETRTDGEDATTDDADAGGTSSG